jgi:hypothetical protein
MENLNTTNFEADEIVSIELVGEMETIDITVDDTHMFYANDIYTHNSAINSARFDLSVISESLGKAQTADVILGLARTDENKREKKAQLIVLKNRNGSDGFELPLLFDTSKVFIEIDRTGQPSHGLENIAPHVAMIEQQAIQSISSQLSAEDFEE